MITWLAASLAAWISASAAERSPSPAAPGVSEPTQVAVFVHGADDQRLAIADLRSGKLQMISPEGVVPYEATWSSTGARLSYRIADVFMVHVDGVSPDRPLFKGTSFGPTSVYAYSPDDRWLGAALRDVVAFLPLAAAPPGSPAPAVVPIAGCGIPELRWSPDGEHLLALCTTGATSPKLIRIALSDRTTSSQNADGVLRTLGWRADGELVVVRRRGSGEEPAILLPSGKSRALYKRQENQFALFYFSGPDQTLFAQGGEDSGDATALRLAGPAPNASRAWLKSFPRLKDLGFSSDGRWVLFVQPLGGDRAGGEVYLVGTGMENPRKVLSATSARSFSQPMSRPVPPR